MQGFGKGIKKLRKERGWSQAVLGEKAGGISAETVSRIENGQNTTTGKLYKIAASLGVPIRELLPEDRRATADNCRSVCPDDNPEHIAYHESAERVLHSGNEMLIKVMTVGLKTTVSQLDRSTPKEKRSRKPHSPQ